MNLLPDEIVLKSSSGISYNLDQDRIVLTTHRLICRKTSLFGITSRSFASLPVGEITYMACRRDLNMVLFLLGILMGAFGAILLAVIAISRESTVVNLALTVASLLVAIGFIIFSRENRAVFSSSGGKLLIGKQGNENLEAWIQAVYSAQIQLHTTKLLTNQTATTPPAPQSHFPSQTIPSEPVAEQPYNNEPQPAAQPSQSLYPLSSPYDYQPPKPKRPF